MTVLKKKYQGGFGLILLVALIAISAILMGSTTLMMTSAVTKMQLEIDQTKAYYLAQAGAMWMIRNWYVSDPTGSDDTDRRNTPTDSTIPGQVYKAGGTNANPIQSNFAYFSFDEGGTHDAGWYNPGGGLRRLRRWTIRNIHNNAGAYPKTITPTKVRVSWSPSGTSRLSDIRLNGTSVIPSGGTFNSGTLLTLSRAMTLASGAIFSGSSTYLQWDTPPADPVTVTVQWTFADDSPTHDSTSHEVVYWNGNKTTSPIGRPSLRTFTITSTGQVLQSGGRPTVLQTVRATVSGHPSSGNVEIIDWQKMDNNIP